MTLRRKSHWTSPSDMELRYHTPLSAEEQIAHGVTTPQRMAIADKVRFSELDSQNHVNNKAYISWMESARVAYSDAYCLSFFDQRPRFMVHSITLRYIREMVIKESYIATCQVTAFRNSSYTLDQQVWAGDMRARMQAVIVLDKPDGSGRYPLPEGLREQFMSLDGARDER